VLSGRKTAGKITGEILFGGVKPTTAFWRRYTGYVEQQDTLIHTLTVEQMIMYTAELKRPREESVAEKKEVVEKVIKALALESCRNRLIGDALNRGISGGQVRFLCMQVCES
jgi:ATP-binding cassette, subfamily G (WHITE), member 2